ncbi:ParM/StbA family protein [Robertmurraya korlensis]|uniref:ParM/StbA family protein n=1 Tax=Robertmurraya korlensis TaxID=519977 RepID=UPI00203C7A1A|nr:ParM/StbA family protein [Robertmurraya korlensis]MCM3603141.1 ParM/StbA family protein [Robertmurraya korlensis]
MKLCVGIDIGNAKTELAFESEKQLQLVRQPSVISYLPRTPESNDLPLEHVMNNLIDNLIVNISSPSIKRNGDYYIGKKAMQHDGIKTNMLINLGGKSTHDLPIITSLSLVAATSVKKHYETEGELPESLSIDLKMATAIPSSEFSRQNAKTLEDRFKNKHIVTLYIGDHQVLTSIKVTDCKVTEEGKTSMLAFLNSDEDILEDYNEIYSENKKPSDFKSTRSLHSDIGDGTSEFVVIEGASPVQGLSKGKRLGVGHASDLAIRLLREQINISDKFTRQQLQEWLKRDNEKGQLARNLMGEATLGQAQAILEEIQTSFQELASSDVDYVFVHGGGSITFKNELQEELMDFAKNNHFKVVWIPAKYATTMNSRGTFYLAKMMYSNKK